MIDFTSLRNALFTGLNTFVGLPVVEANQNTMKPPYPFITILFMSATGAGAGHTGSIYAGDNGDDDLDYRLVKNEIFTISLTAVGNNSAAVNQLAYTAAEWFNWVGVEYLKNNGMVVARMEAMGSRDALIVDNFERRVGFDVRLRTLSDITIPMEWIGRIGLVDDDGNYSKDMNFKTRELI